MRAELAPLAAAAIYLFAGFGVLAALGMVGRSLTGVLAACGLAYLSGVAAVLLPGIALLTIGVSLDLARVVAIAAAVGCAGLLAAWLRSDGSRPRHERRNSIRTPRLALGLPRWSAEQWAAAVFVAAIAAYAAIGYFGTSVEPLTGWDAMSIWSRKALLLVEYGKPTSAFFSSPYYEFMNPDYPILVPLYESIYFRLADTADFQALHGQFWVLFVAFLWSAGFLAYRIARPLVWAPLIALLAVTPALADDVTTLYADVPMALFLGLGVLLLGLWFSDGGDRHLALAALMLAAAANTKNEGLAAAAGILLVALLVSWARARSSPRRTVVLVLAAAAGVALAVAPWRLWVAAHDVPNVTTPVGKGLDPGFLANHADRIGPTVSAIGSEVGDPSRWFYLLPLTLGIALATLWMRRDRLLVAFYIGAGLVVFIAIVIWGYVINTIPIDSLIHTTVSRTVDGFMLVAIAALLHLSARALPAPERLTSRRMSAGEQVSRPGRAHRR
jgi:hypothetical protein